MALLTRSLGGVGAVLVSAALLTGCGRTEGGARAAVSTVSSTPFVTQQSAAPRPRAARRYSIAAVRHRTILRDAPGGRAIVRLGMWTQFGSPMMLAVVGRRGGWLRVASAELPNGRRGWISARRVRLWDTDYDIQIDRSARRAVLRHDGRAVLRFPVAVGRPGRETPLGRFAVTDKIRITGPASPYGCCALALTGHQTQLEPGWPGGDRLAIHGTPVPASIGQAVSLGCMRADKAVMRRLMRRLPLGAPVFIRA